MTGTCEKVSDSEKKKEDWMNSKWRPAMGWVYMSVCVFDFVIAPVAWSILQALSKGQVNAQWQPLTLQGAGLFHLAMGAVLGLSAYGRTQEKLGGANNGGISLPSNVGTTYTPPAPIAGNSGFGGASSTPSSGFGSAANTGFGSAAPAANTGFGSAAPAANTGFGSAAPADISTTASGKKIVPDSPQPLI